MKRQFFENIFISRSNMDNPIAKRIIAGVDFSNIVYHEGENHPGNGLLIAENKGSFIKPCPGQKGSVCCNYWVVEWGMGCPFKCEYCILQNYSCAGDMTLFINWDKCFEEIAALRDRVKGPIRIGTGQFGDPLGLEEIFPLNTELIKLTENYSDFLLELKTKSDYIKPVLEADKAKHIVLAFSLNPQNIIDKLEHFTADLESRLKAARQACIEKDCKLAFHFDPIIPHENWKENYNEVFRKMSEFVGGLDVVWISMGTFRFPKGFQDYVIKFHPDTEIFKEEFHPSFDGKVRYFRPYREEIYSFARAGLKKYFPDTQIYMCMESSDVWERVQGVEFFSPDLRNFLDVKVTPGISNGPERDK